MGYIAREQQRNYQSPAPVLISDSPNLSAFLNWTVEALSYWPLNNDAKVVVDELIACQKRPFTSKIALSLKMANGFLQWIKEAGEAGEDHQLDEESKTIVRLFTTYRDYLLQHQSRLRDYWTQ